MINLLSHCPKDCPEAKCLFIFSKFYIKLDIQVTEIKDERGLCALNITLLFKSDASLAGPSKVIELKDSNQEQRF
jgi:hypothetical protein